MDEDGADCVILVENVLFNVHRFVLSKDSSAFRDMFSLPSKPGDHTAAPVKEGTSDESPIVLSESIDLFRALLWVLYALPQDLDEICRKSDHAMLIKLATITHKYHFASTEEWALRALCRIVSDDDYMAAVFEDAAQLGPLLDVAMLCDHEDLQGALLCRWENELLSDTSFPATRAILAEKPDIRSLKGFAYYRTLIQMETIGQKIIVDLPREHRVCLLSGHWSLSVEWYSEIQRSAPPFTRCSDCIFHVHGCIRTWNQRWDDCSRLATVVSLPPTALLEKLIEYRKFLSQDDDLKAALTPGCKNSAFVALGNLIRNTMGNLADHFVDRILSPPPPL